METGASCPLIHSNGSQVQRPTPSPQSFPKDVQEDHKEENRSRHSRLNPKAPLRSHRQCPPDLKIAHDEAACRSREVDPRSYLTTRFRVRVKVVGIHSNCCDHDSKDIEPPSNGGYHVMIPILETEADEDETCEHEGCGEVDC